MSESLSTFYLKTKKGKSSGWKSGNLARGCHCVRDPVPYMEPPRSNLGGRHHEEHFTD